MGKYKTLKEENNSNPLDAEVIVKKAIPVELPVMHRFRIHLRSGNIIEKEAEGFTYQDFYTFGVADDKEEEYPQPEIPVIVFYKNGETILDEFYPLANIDAIIKLEGA